MIKKYIQKSINLLPKKLKQNYKNLVLGIILITSILGIASYKHYVSGNKQIPTKSVKMANIAPASVSTESTTPTTQPDPENSDQPVNPPSPTPSPTLTVSPTPAATPMPTSTPTRIPNPPILSISFPSEMQSVEFTSPEQQLCVVDVPTGGDTSGLRKKHSINDTPWSSYIDTYTLCFEPKEGLNRFSIQYKNQYDEESTIYTRQFNFHGVQQITVSVTGIVYSDQNCNGNKDTDEGGISGVTINIFKNPEFYLLATISTDGSGNYSWSKTIKENEYIGIQLVPVSPSGYKANPNDGAYAIGLKSDYRSATYYLPQVPNENVGKCF